MLADFLGIILYIKTTRFRTTSYRILKAMKKGNYWRQVNIITVLGISRKGTGGVATGIENIENRPAVNAAEGIYTINGVKINSLQKGINIIKMADGTTRKVVIK